MNKLRFLCLCLVLVLALTFSATALGDDVDFGGDDWGGGWDDGGWDDDDDDWGWSDSGSDYGGGSGTYLGGPSVLFSLFGSSPTLLIIIIVVIFITKRRKGAASVRPSQRPSGSTKRPDPASIQALMRQDPNFSVADVEAKVKNWVMMFEQAWSKGDMTSCRPFLSDGLYNSYQKQLDMMKQNGEASRTEDLAVVACSVERWVKDGDKEYLDVWLHEKKRTYKVNINNPSQVIKGDKQVTYNLEYRWQLMRSANSQSDNAGIRVAECPNCGAQTSVNQSGKCDYCGSTLSAESFDWVLNKVDKLSQRSHR